MTEFYDWEEVRAELHDGDDEAVAAERARTGAWVRAFHRTEELGRPDLTQRQLGERGRR
jgi:hypothetical protein